VEYFQIVDYNTLQPLNKIEGNKAIGCVAVWAGKVRLIDNIVFNL
jgi:pantoate--beta-alanine ligase